MTTMSLASNRRRSFLVMIGLGGAIGVTMSLGMYVLAKPTSLVLLPVGLTILLPTLILKNSHLYWFTLFLLSLQFSISKNINDGLSVINKLNIDYTIMAFTFEITASDLALLVLVAIWTGDRMFRRRPTCFPPVTWLAIGYLGISLLSIVGTPWPYLGFVEMSRQIKLFIVYLFAVNCLDSKSTLRVLAVVGVIILVTQGGMAVARFETGYMLPLTFGDTRQDVSQIEEYLSVDRYDEGGLVRAFGTLGSPGSTVRLCMLVIPFALFLCARNPMFKARLPFVMLTAFGIFGLVLTFTRVYYITTAVQLFISYLIMLRDRMLKREEAIAIVLVSVVALAAVSPKLYEQFTVRENSASVRFLQYEAAGRMILAHPFLGVGLNNSTGQKRDYSKLTYVPYDADTQFYLEPTHNMYLSMASEIGVVGTLLFLGFFVRVTWVAWRQSRHATDPEIRMVANALVVAFISVAVNSFMDPLQEYPVLALLWLYAGISLNLHRIDQTPQVVVMRSPRLS